MATLGPNSRFVVDHSAGTPDDPNLASLADIAGQIGVTSTTISIATSSAISSITAAAPDSVSISTADSKGVSAGSRASVADSKAVSDSVVTSVADSKAGSVSVNTSIADSKGTSAGVASVSATNPPRGGRTVATVGDYLNNNAVFNVKDFGAIGDGITNDQPAFATALTSLPTKGGTVYVPPGTYKLSANVSVTPDATQFDGGYIEIVMAPGAKLKPANAVTECISFNAACSQNAWVGVTGGVIDGVNGSGTMVGIGIHTQNVKVHGTTVQNCGGEGVKYFYDLSAPPICSELHNYSSLFNKNGVYCAVAASGLYMHGCRIEGSDEEGCYFNNCGKICLVGNVIETNGFVTASKPNLKIKNAVDGLISGNYFESILGQSHTCIDIEGDTSLVFALAFLGNRVVNGNSLGDALSIGLNIGSSAGGVEGVIAHGNEYVGQTVAVRVGATAVAYLIGPDYFSDNFNPAGSAHTRYSMVSTRAGIVYDLNRYASIIYNVGVSDAAGSFTTLATSGLHTAAAGTRYTGGTSVDGSVVKSAISGLTARGITGSSYDGLWTGAGGVGVWANPTGTQVLEVFATIKNVRTTITYSASMTPNADAGEFQTITATNGTAFTINAPTNPRLGQRLVIRLRNISGGVLGAITVNAVYKLVGSAWPSPSNGFSRVLVLDYDGTNWVEATRGAADVPN